MADWVGGRLIVISPGPPDIAGHLWKVRCVLYLGPHLGSGRLNFVARNAALRLVDPTAGRNGVHK